jgi:phosphopantothenoylcysteine decarboxylase/phosphopantothenate--cysteine ligase
MEMAAAALPLARAAHVFVAAAAVADQRPRETAPQKVKKREGEELLPLVRTPDVLATATLEAPEGEARPLFVGFAAETERVVANAREKLARKRLDLIAANEVGAKGKGFASASNALVLIDRSGKARRVPQMSKDDAAHALLDRVQELLAERDRGRGRPRAPRARRPSS